MKNNLRVSNMVMTGRIPFKRKLKLDETNKLIQRLNWIIINEECSPILQKKILRGETKLSVHHKEKGMLLCLWASGAVNITGIITRKEGNKGYEKIISDLRKVTRGLL